MGEIQKASSKQLTNIRELVASKKIRDLLDDNDIKTNLVRVYTLLGLPTDKWPNGLEKKLIYDFILRNYGGYHPSEITIAFERALKGELGLSDNDIKTYNSFNCAYFAMIMRAYQKKRESDLAKTSSKSTYEPPPNLTVDEVIALYERQLFKPYDKLFAEEVYYFTGHEERFLYRGLHYLFNHNDPDTNWRMMPHEDAVKLFEDTIKEITAEEKKKPRRSRLTDEKIERKARTRCQCKTFKNWIQEQEFAEIDLRTLITNKIKEVYD